MTRPLIYLAGPYTLGNQALNVRSQVLLWHELMEDGLVFPYAPLLSHLAELIKPRGWQEWMDHSFVMVGRCDALLRRPATADGGYFQESSRGADLEVQFCVDNGIPWFSSKEHLYGWVRAEQSLHRGSEASVRAASSTAITEG